MPLRSRTTAVTFAVLTASLPAQEHHGMVTRQAMEQLFRYSCATDQAGTPAGDAFGRMFNPGSGFPEEKLEALAQAMRESNANGLQLSHAPVGIVFLGQFIDHDITLDVLTQLGEVADPSRITNFRTPELDLDSVYGNGPEASPLLYDRHRHGYLATGHAENPDDLARTAQHVALIGDPRNDENGVIAQMHLLFLRFHNAVLANVERGIISGGRLPGENDFEFARRLVRWHYQWIVRHEFLPAVVDGPVLAGALKEVLHPKHPVCASAPAMPVEFAVAAYRFGHSMVPGAVNIAPGRMAVNLFRPPVSGLPSFDPVPVENVVDWQMMFAWGGSVPQRAARLDTHLADVLFALPFTAQNNLALRNLLRGNTFSLPTGEAAARALGKTPLPLHPAVKQAQLTETPLWFYCLYEAEQGEGRLGPVGGTIVALTLLRALYSDATAYPQADDPGKGWNGPAAKAELRASRDEARWKPTLPRLSGLGGVGDFSFADIAAYANSD